MPPPLLSPDKRHELEIEQQASPGVTLTRSRPMPAGPQRAVDLTGLLADPNRGLPNPDDLSYSVYNRLRHDPTISHGLLLKKAPILGRVRGAVVECDDPSIKRVAEHEFLDRGLLSRVVERALRALDFGAMFGEKEWQVYDRDLTYTTTDAVTGEEVEESAWQGPLLTLADVREVNPEDVTEVRLRTEARDGKPGDGSFDGFRCRVQGKAQPVDVVVQKAFVFTHQLEFGNYWGEPLTKAAYPFFFWKQVDLKLEHALGERKVSPNRVIRYPDGIDTQTGEDNQDVALGFGSMIDSQVAIAMPSETDANGKFRWDVEEKTLTDRTNVFSALIQQDDDQMLRAIGVPSRAFLEGQYGTKAEAEAHTDTMLMSLDELLYGIVDAVNDYLVAPLLLVNFGADAPKARIRVSGLTDDERAMRKQIVTMLLSNPEIQAQVDVEALFSPFAIPLKQEPEGQAALPNGNAPGAVSGGPQGLLPPQNAPEAVPPVSGAPAPSGAAPANLILADLDDDEQFELLSILLAEDDPIALAEAFDPSMYQIEPDPKALNGYKVISRRSGKRLSGFSANQVLKAYFSYARKQGEKAARASATAGRHAAAEQKRQQRAAETASRKAEREAIKRQKAGEREVAKQQREQARQTKAQQREAAKQQHEQARQHKAGEREAARTQREQQRSAVEADRARASVVSGERTQIEHEARTNPNTALATLASKGYSQVGAFSDHDAAREQARTMAQRDPNSLYTVVKVANQYVIARKAKSAVDSQVHRAGTTPANVVAVDAGGLTSLGLSQTGIELAIPGWFAAPSPDASDALKELGVDAPDLGIYGLGPLTMPVDPPEEEEEEEEDDEEGDDVEVLEGWNEEVDEEDLDEDDATALHDVPQHTALWRQAEERLREFFAPPAEDSNAETPNGAPDA